MNVFAKFTRGYMQTMLYGIEERPTYKMTDGFYFTLHLINHFQYISIIFQAYSGETYSDFKLSYTQTFMEFFILNNTLQASLSYSFAVILIVLSFMMQMILFSFLCLSTIIRIYTSSIVRRDNSTNINSGIQAWVLKFNETLHWMFVIYPVIYLQTSAISFSSLTCNTLSLIPLNQCTIGPGIQILAIVPLAISFIHGQILVYIMRNHRFHETNSLKRRYSMLLMLNNSLILIQVAFHYIYQFNAADSFRYIVANIFALLQIVDQLGNFPYRDPIRIPSIRLAFAYWWVVVSITIFRFTSYIDEYNLFFFITLPLPFFGILGEVISGQLQGYALVNYNSNIQIEEKHIIIAVDEFYKHHLDFLQVSNQLLVRVLNLN